MKWFAGGLDVQKENKKQHKQNYLLSRESYEGMDLETIGFLKI